MRLSALIVAVMVLAALTLLPALLGLVGKRINTFRVLGGRTRKRRTRKAGRGGWLRWGQHVRGHRWLYTIGATLVLLVLTVPLLSLRLGMPDDRVQPVTETRRQAYDLIARSFGPGYNGPMLIAVDLAGTDRSLVDKLIDKVAEVVKADPAVAVIADATVIRMMLVPAVMSLLGRAAWWFPGRKPKPAKSTHNPKTLDHVRSTKDDLNDHPARSN